MNPLPFLAALLLASLVLGDSAKDNGSKGSSSDPMNPGESPGTVPAFPVQSEAQLCRLDLSDELFGGVKEACGQVLDRSRCCPVLAAWLFAAHARSALQPAGPVSSELPAMPDDSQKCVSSLQASLQSRDISLAQPNATCDTVLCFCGIRLHQIGSLSCPAAFNITNSSRPAVPTPAVRALESSCRNASYSGCTRCLTALQKLKEGENYTKDGNDRASKMFSRDCQLMSLTWLLAKNKTAYIPTVSAVLRAVMYSTHPHQSKCSPDQENMPLAVDSLQFLKAESSAAMSSPKPALALFLHLFPLVLLPWDRVMWIF
ncbi:putative GPI-anchored protein [Nymphaea thermarum]|nr:putative GPI-anchored protein [Nymphaea thermarum]